MSHYKRKVADREVTFRRPDWQCLACNDSGIVTNADGLLTALLGDYDVHPDTGIIHGGLDCAVICRCQAAYPSYGDSGEATRNAFRDGRSIRDVETEQGPRTYGFDCPKEIFDALIAEREIQWAATEKLMNTKRAAGDKTPADFMQQAKAQLTPNTWKTTNSGFSPLSVSLPNF